MDIKQITPEQVQLAKSVNLLSFLEQAGYSLKHVSSKEWCLAEHDSFKISNNLWFWHSQDRGGGIVDFAMHYPDPQTRTFKEAIAYIYETMGYYLSENLDTKGKPESFYNNVIGNLEAQLKKENKKDIVFALPEANENNKRVFAYLTKTRGIDHEIVNKMIKEGYLYESKDKHNAIFVGFNKDGEAKAASQRGTLTDKRWVGDVPGSDKSFSFVMHGKGKRVLLFESAIDAMSHATMCKMQGQDWCKDTRLVLNSVNANALNQYLQDYPETQVVISCLDNDQAGLSQSRKIIGELFGKAFAEQVDYIETWQMDFKLLDGRQIGAGIIRSDYKDWNLDLLHKKGIAISDGIDKNNQEGLIKPLTFEKILQMTKVKQDDFAKEDI